MSKLFLESFQKNWNIHFSDLQPGNCKLIVAVSGGVDSVVLAHILHTLSFDFIIAHCNFHLRGEDSDRDERFVSDLAKTLNKPIHCKHFDTIQYSKIHKKSMEEAARELRYDWFRQIADEYKISENPLPIFVAHHANDSIETLLINLFRGCGIAGLHGILPISNDIYRPLLFAKRNDIVKYALYHHLSWVEDVTNKDEKYTRNFLRNNILPELKEHFPSIEDNLLDSMERFKSVENIYNQHIESVKKELLEKKTGYWQIDISAIKKQENLNTIVYEFFKEFGFYSKQTTEIIKLLDAQVGGKIFSQNYIIWKDRDLLIVTPSMDERERIILWNENDVAIKLNNQTIISQNIVPENIPSFIVLDKEKLSFPLTIRHWKEGDYFYPAGMNGKKKLAKYFVDQKIPNPIKQKIWLITSENHIVWVVGYRADQRYIATEHTKQKIYLTISLPD